MQYKNYPRHPCIFHPDHDIRLQAELKYMPRQEAFDILPLNKILLFNLFLAKILDFSSSIYTVPRTFDL